MEPLLITFSGLDGSGKSTQIEALIALLRTWGYGIRQLTFWDDVVVLKRYRERFVHKVYNSEQGIGAPGHPVDRRDKNVRTWYLTPIRHLLYLLDAVHLRWVIERERSRGPYALVMDRYIFDELANLPLQNRFSCACIRLMAAIAPQPDIAFVLDADPEAARARKPEYPVEFMRECRGWYHELARLLGTLTVVPALPLPEVKRAVALRLRRKLAPDEYDDLALRRKIA